MSLDGVTVLAVIPARGGSKGIPRKNLKQIAGRSLVGHTAEVTAALPWIDHAVLSTDDEEIAAEGRRCGLETPFLRPDSLAGDLSTSVDMWRHAWVTSEETFGMRFDVSILLEPTSPLRRPSDVEATMHCLLDGGHASVATVSPTPAHYTPHKTLTLDASGRIGFYLEGGAQHSIRQTIPDYYHRNGICYALRRKTLVDKGHILEDGCRAVVIDRPVVNIDSQFDLELAEFLLGRETEHHEP